MTVEARVPISSIPSVKQAVRELGYDMVTGDVENGFMSCHFLIPEYGSLLSIGFIAGTNAMHTIITQPAKEFRDILEDKINTFLKKKDDENRQG